MAGRLGHLIRHGLARLRWPLAGLAATVFVLACMLVIPQWLVRWELGSQARTLTAVDRAKAINDVRSTLLQGIGGAVLLLGAYFTYRQLQTGRNQLHIAQQGQVTERFTRAIDQLGHAELDVRLGGIYALERIANDSPNDRATIAEVLTAFVRGHAPWPPHLPGQYVADAPMQQVPELQVRAPDVQAALTVLARRQPASKSTGRLDLHGTDLRSASLAGANLQGTNLDGANLQEADLRAANLQGARLDEAQLQGPASTAPNSKMRASMKPSSKGRSSTALISMGHASTTPTSRRRASTPPSSRELALTEPNFRGRTLAALISMGRASTAPTSRRQASAAPGSRGRASLVRSLRMLRPIRRLPGPQDSIHAAPAPC